MASLTHLWLVWIALTSLVEGKACSIAHDCNIPNQVCKDGICAHKPLLPMIINDGISPVLLMTGIALSNAAGIGGGAISMPVLLALLGFSQPQAVSIANFLMFLGAVARILVTWRDKNPRFSHKIAVNYDFIVILLPLALVGTLIGVLINQTFPEIILSTCTVLLFLYVIYNSVRKGIKLRSQEKQKCEDVSEPLISITPSCRSKAVTSSTSATLDHISQEARTLLQREGTHFQLKKQALIFSVFGSLICLTLLRGNGTFSIIKRCSAFDWISQFIFFLICLLAVLIAAKILSNENRIRVQSGIPIDVEWSTSTISKFAGISIFIGIISGGLGLGGGVIVTPILFSMGQPPSVASLTSVYLIFFSTLSATIQFIVIGSLNYQYALFNGAFVLMGSILGLWLIGSWIQRSNKQSVLVFLLTFVAIFAVSSVIVFEVLKVQKELKQGENILEFAAICPL